MIALGVGVVVGILGTLLIVSSWRRPGRLVLFGVLAVLVLFILHLGMPFGRPQHMHFGSEKEMRQCRTIAIAAFYYAKDHDGKYPDGDSSTEIFQKLLDGGYLINPGIVYVPLAGKTKAAPGARLKPENVSFDATGGVGRAPRDEVPIVFLTGYRVDYRPGGEAVSLIKPEPPFTAQPATWTDWLNNEEPGAVGNQLIVTYASNTSIGKKLTLPPGGYAFVPEFVSKDFQAQGKTYRQLTPEGLLK